MKTPPVTGLQAYTTMLAHLLAAAHGQLGPREYAAVLEIAAQIVERHRREHEPALRRRAA